jgi:16S rRNA (adenine1518-N6/adenine1519-N6)-dimethyltransferase
MALTRAEIRQLLDDFDMGPSRALGQNFLCDAGMVDKIVRLARVGPGDHVIEIGPGLGSLTLGLCRTGAGVIAVEIDRYLLAPLRRTVGAFERSGQLTIINDDAMTLDWSRVIEPGVDYSVVANLPYNIATPLILDLLAGQPALKRWVVMVQREAGERLVAQPGSKTYGIPSVLLAYWAEARLAGSVPAGLFFPRPNVESVLVVIERRADSRVPNEFDQLARLVRTAFGQRRKMLRRSLSGVMTVEAMETVGVDPTARPEQLSLADWIRLATVTA